ncbi:MAG: SxtJ family membrane protein [Planctomycetota bacterium]|jgi:hypothetical protein
MIIEDIRTAKGARKELRRFGIIMAVAFGVIGGLLLWREKEHYIWFLILSGAFLLLGIAVPNLLRPVYKMWMTLAGIMGWFMTRIILIVLFYLVATPIGLLMRLLGKDFLELKLNRSSAVSYWIPREGPRPGVENYNNQF